MKKKSIWIILGIVLGILLILGGYFILKPKPSPIEKPPVTEEPPVESEEEKKLKEKITQYQLEEHQTLIQENKDLFRQYLEIVENNDKLDSFELYVMNLFPIVAQYQQHLEKDYFFEKLAKLNIIVEPNLNCGSNAAGCYRDGLTQIAIESWNINQENAFPNVRVLYHELMHFIDFSFTSLRTKVYSCNQKNYTVEQYYALSEEEKKQYTYIGNSILNLITEGGAETWMARYFNQGEAITYTKYTDRYEILNALLGIDIVDEMFLVSNHSTKLYEFLVTQNAIAKETYDRLWKYLSMDNLTNENRVYFIDTCIEIYEQLYQKNWYEDNVFAYLMLNYIKDFIPMNHLYNSPNIMEYKNYYSISYVDINNTITKAIENGKYTLCGPSKIVHYQGKHQLSLYVIYKENGENKFGNLFVNYDFDNHNIMDYRLKPDSDIIQVNP